MKINIFTCNALSLSKSSRNVQSLFCPQLSKISKKHKALCHFYYFDRSHDPPLQQKGRTETDFHLFLLRVTNRVLCFHFLFIGKTGRFLVLLPSDKYDFFILWTAPGTNGHDDD